jgi:hypothetical protein
VSRLLPAVFHARGGVKFPRRAPRAAPAAGNSPIEARPLDNAPSPSIGLPTLLLIATIVFFLGYRLRVGLESSPVAHAPHPAAAIPPAPLPALPPAPSPPPMPAAPPAPSRSWPPLPECGEFYENGSPPLPSLAGVHGAMGFPEHNPHLGEWWSHSSLAKLPEIAFAVQGHADGLRNTMEMYAAMATRAHVTLFLLTWNEPIDCSAVVAASLSAGGPPHAVCVFAPWTSWTTGRNALARAIFHAELARGERYTKWLFADQDTTDGIPPGGIACSQETSIPAHVGLGTGAAVCPGSSGAPAWDAVIRVLLLPLRHPFLYFISNVAMPYVDWEAPEHKCPECLTVWPIDCADAMVNAFDRDAVAALLPYFFELDPESWWASQEILYHFAEGCFGGTGGVVPGFYPTTTQHRSYPQGRPIKAEMEVVRQAFPELFEWPLNMTEKLGWDFPHLAFEQGDCAFRALPFQRLNAALPAHVAASHAWPRLPDFRACVDSMLPRYCAFMLNVTQPYTEAGVTARASYPRRPQSPS